ncbi:hypothetical protein R1sor_014933 [Riccia sorocarpa]|uniref:Uncharacterized protein n=1 Tax=Riccia sorocarpa TaxID=122646 RepID=A0ABD3HGZ3_9MARC
MAGRGSPYSPRRSAVQANSTEALPKFGAIEYATWGDASEPGKNNPPSRSSGGARRIDLFNGQCSSHLDPGELLIMTNEVYDGTLLSSKRIGSGSQAQRSPTQGDNRPPNSPNPWFQGAPSSQASLEARELARQRDPVQFSPSSTNPVLSPIQIPREIASLNRDPAPQEVEINSSNKCEAEEDTLSWAEIEEDTCKDEDDDDLFNMSEINSEKRAHKMYMEDRKWLKNMKKEVTSAFAQLQEYEGEPETEEVVVEHHFTAEEKVRIHSRKRCLEDCAVVLCTVDISPSRDAFIQWVYQEVENKSAVQAVHVKVLAPRH